MLVVSYPKLIDCAYFQLGTDTTYVSLFLDLCYIALSYNDDGLVGDGFDFIQPPRSIASLLVVVLFKVMQ